MNKHCKNSFKSNKDIMSPHWQPGWLNFVPPHLQNKNNSRKQDNTFCCSRQSDGLLFYWSFSCIWAFFKFIVSLDPKKMQHQIQVEFKGFIVNKDVWTKWFWGDRQDGWQGDGGDCPERGSNGRTQEDVGTGNGEARQVNAVFFNSTQNTHRRKGCTNTHPIKVPQ